MKEEKLFFLPVKFIAFFYLYKTKNNYNNFYYNIMKQTKTLSPPKTACFY